MSHKRDPNERRNANDRYVGDRTHPVRAGDALFQADNARGSRMRSNVRLYDPIRAGRNQLFFGLGGAVVTFFVLLLLQGTLVKLITNYIATSNLLHPMMPGIIYHKAGYWITAGLKSPWFWLLVGAGGLAAGLLKRYWDAKAAEDQDMSDINTYADDAYPLTLEECLMAYAVFPDAGAVSKSVSMTSILSHVTLKNDARLPKFEIFDRDKDGNLKFDDAGNIKKTKVQLFDEEQAHGVFKTNGILDPKDHYLFNPYDFKYQRKIKKTAVTANKFSRFFHRSGAANELGSWMSLGEFIAQDWYLPEYEPERPSGAFIVETAAVNTFVIAITRGNKGQLWVNNTVDCWSREKEPQNIFGNDPKGEIFAGFHDILELRGMEVMSFNLMNPIKSNQFNVLVPSISAARKGDITMMQQGIMSLMESFFPIDKEGEPFWSQSQQTLVRMMVYALIDNYVEEEREYIDLNAGMDPAVINKHVDALWGQVTMFNAYQMLTVLSREKIKINFDYYKDADAFMLANQSNPDFEVTNTTKVEKIVSVKLSNGLMKEFDEDKINAAGEEINKLEAFFKSMEFLPANSLRDSALQQQNAIGMMADSEKTRATIYGMTLVAMLFFTELPIARITSASPSQSFDPISLAFPRRLRIKFNTQYLRANRYDTQTAFFTAYHDDAFTQKYEGKDFEHQTQIDELGWVEFVFKGIFEDFDERDEEIPQYDADMNPIAPLIRHIKVPKPVYIKMTIRDAGSGLKMNEFYFEFIRGYQKSADGSEYVVDPRNHERLMKDGTLRTGTIQEIPGYHKKDGDSIRHFKRYSDIDKARKRVGSGRVTLPQRNPDGSLIKVYPIDQTEAVYSVRPKAIFAITPPHLASYIKIVLLIVSVFFSESVAKSYLTKENGKPFYLTRSMLDELGNMQVDGHGIENFQTKLSIGLGQGQQYTMILQTIQQLKDVYGDSVDKIVSGNTAVSVYLLSNEPEMLETLSKQAGVTHVSRPTSKVITKKRDFFGQHIQDETPTTWQTSEEPLFSVNRLERFTLGEALVTSTHRETTSHEAVRPAPIYDSNKTIMPMAWYLHRKGSNSSQFKHALINVPTAASTRGLDVYNNIPDFDEMYKKRLRQAKVAPHVRELYKKQMGLSDADLRKRNKDEVAEDLMRAINEYLHRAQKQTLATAKMKQAEIDRKPLTQAQIQDLPDAFDPDSGSTNEADAFDNSLVEIPEPEAEAALVSNDPLEDGVDIESGYGNHNSLIGDDLPQVELDRLKQALTTPDKTGEMDVSTAQAEAKAAYDVRQKSVLSNGVTYGQWIVGDWSIEIEKALNQLNLRAASDLNAASGLQWRADAEKVELRNASQQILATRVEGSSEWSITPELFHDYLKQGGANWQIDIGNQFGELLAREIKNAAA